MNNENNQNVVSNQKKFPIVPIIIGVVAFLTIIAIIIAVVVVILVNSEPKEKVYINENEVSMIYGSPNSYKKKYVKLTGEVYSVKYDKKGQTLNVMTDIQNYTNEVIVYIDNKSVALKQNDYISIDGYIKGGDKETGKPYIIGKDVKTISYLEATSPTKKEVNVDKAQDQNDVTITLQKVEFSDTETRVYLKVVNGMNNEFHFQGYGAILSQAGKQYETTYSKNEIEMSSTILPGGNTEGSIVFPKVEQNNFTLTLKGYAEDYHIDFENFKFDVRVD